MKSKNIGKGSYIRGKKHSLQEHKPKRKKSIMRTSDKVKEDFIKYLFSTLQNCQCLKKGGKSKKML